MTLFKVHFPVEVFVNLKSKFKFKALSQSITHNNIAFKHISCSALWFAGFNAPDWSITEAEVNLDNVKVSDQVSWNHSDTHLLQIQGLLGTTKETIHLELSTEFNFFPPNHRFITLLGKVGP